MHCQLYKISTSGVGNLEIYTTGTKKQSITKAMCTQT